MSEKTLRPLLFRVFFLSDSVQIRVLMAWASGWWSWNLWTTPSFMDRPYYAGMLALAPAWAWGIAFFLHAAGAAWRILDTKERRVWALVVNGWGVAVWGFSVILQIFVAGHWVPTTNLEVASTFMLFCAFVSSGWNQNSTTA